MMDGFNDGMFRQLRQYFTAIQQLLHSSIGYHQAICKPLNDLKWLYNQDFIEKA